MVGANLLVPCVSAFYGIRVYLYYKDHAPPHFHAVYAGREATVEIRSGHVLVGSLPVRAQRMLAEWTARYREELLEDWARAREGRELAPIPPLE